MNGRIILATSEKGAFRVEVAGVRPDDITRLILTGQGDECELELPVGAYIAKVTNIGTGDRRSISFEIGETEQLVRIDEGRTRSANWRSVSEKGRPPEGWRSAGQESSSTADSRKLQLPSLQVCDLSGWQSFSGNVMINEGLPNTLKIARSKTWSETPLLRIEFTGSNGDLIHSFVPFFNGGTLIQWNCEDKRQIEIKPSEPKSAAIVASLTGSVREELPQILQWAAGSDEVEAVQSVMNSRDDPWLAVATGLLLIGSNRLKQSGSSLARLAARNAWMADLGVLSAWGRATDAPSDTENCLQQLTHARERGFVYFWQTCTIADRLLIALASSSATSDLRTRARKELGCWRKLQADAFKIGAFLGWDDSSRSKR